MRVAAGIFWGFCLVLVITIATVLLLNPDADKPYFIAQTITIFGGLCASSAFVAWRLPQGKGIIAACVIAGFLTQVVLVGLAQDGALQLQERVHPVMAWLRTFGGVYILLLWFAIALAVREKRSKHSSSNRGPQIMDANISVTGAGGHCGPPSAS